MFPPAHEMCMFPPAHVATVNHEPYQLKVALFHL